MRSLLLLVVLAGCSSTDFKALRPQLKTYLTECMRKQGFRDMRTDEDSRARPPTKYTDATKGLAFTIRHTAKFEDNPVIVATWVYESAKARAAAKAPFQTILDDLIKDHREHKLFTVDLDSPEVHATLLMESPSLSPTNQFVLLHKAILERQAEMKEMK